MLISVPKGIPPGGGLSIPLKAVAPSKACLSSQVVGGQYEDRKLEWAPCMGITGDAAKLCVYFWTLPSCGGFLVNLSRCLIMEAAGQTERSLFLLKEARSQTCWIRESHLLTFLHTTPSATAVLSWRVFPWCPCLGISPSLDNFCCAYCGLKLASVTAWEMGAQEAIISDNELSG